MIATTDTAIVIVALRLLDEDKRKLSGLKQAEIVAVGRKARELVGLITSVPGPSWEAKE